MPKPSSQASKRSKRLEPPLRYFGGKRLIAPTVWELLGNPQSYIEPFAGGLAVLLARPMPIAANVHETVNDIDGTIVNIWRSIRQDPETLAVWLDRPPAEADLVAVHNYLVENKERIEQLVKSHPDACDTLAAAYHLHYLRYKTRDFRLQGTLRTAKPHHTVHRRNYQLMLVRDYDLRRAIFDKQGAAQLYAIARRLRYVRILCGDWSRCFTGYYWRGKESSGSQLTVGVYMDPPYADTDRSDVYTHESYEVAYEAMEWCLQHAHEPWLRIVFSSYDEFLKPPWCERLAAGGWRIINWKAKGGYSGLGKREVNLNPRREVLYISPNCRPHPQAVLLADLLG
jgi:site-specific DNA-adenine methylase